MGDKGLSVSDNHKFNKFKIMVKYKRITLHGKFIITDLMMLSPILKTFLHNSIALQALVINKISSLFMINRFYPNIQSNNALSQTIQIHNSNEKNLIQFV
jgi:hypothetical protein